MIMNYKVLYGFIDIDQEIFSIYQWARMQQDQMSWNSWNSGVANIKGNIAALAAKAWMNFLERSYLPEICKNSSIWLNIVGACILFQRYFISVIHYGRIDKWWWCGKQIWFDFFLIYFILLSLLFTFLSVSSHYLPSFRINSFK